MHAVDLLAAACPEDWREPLPQEPVNGTCCLTGQYGPTISRSKVFGASFTEFETFKVSESDRVGINVWYAFRAGYFAAEGKKRKKKPEAMACWWTDGKSWIELNKVKIRELVFEGAEGLPWAGWVTTSYKKHGATRAPVNRGKFGVWGFDESLPDCSDIDLVTDWWGNLREAQNGGLKRTVIETLEIPVFVYNKIDTALWLKFRGWAADKRESALYRFLCYLLPSQAELKDLQKKVERVEPVEQIAAPVEYKEVVHDSFTVDKQLSLF